MFLITDAVEHMRRTQSALYHIAAAKLRDGEYGGYSWMRTLAQKPMFQEAVSAWQATGRMKALALYANTSGSTRNVMSVLASSTEFSMTVIDIGSGQPIPSAREFDIVIAATPTYGHGDAHYLWQRRGVEIFSQIPASRIMALIALGDARGHPRTFAGGLKVLKNLAGNACPLFVGAVSSSDYLFERSESAEEGVFPGLVLEYRRNYRAAESRAISWINQLPAQIHVAKNLLQQRIR